MATIIPDFCAEDSPDGEQLLMERLRGAPDDWIILHSLDLCPYNRNRRTEIDFLVIIPTTGILCVEVKSHRKISCNNGRWASPPGRAEIRKSPFKQADDATMNFRRRLVESLPQFRDIPVARLVIFTHANFDFQPNLQFADFELIDHRAFTHLQTGELLAQRLQKTLESSIQQDPALSRLSRPLNQKQCADIKNLCQPYSKLPQNSRLEIREREERAQDALLEQQRPILALAEDNPRLLVKGPAGTGKTLIAMELACRLADKGHRVGLLCFNRLVADFLNKQMEDEGKARPQVIVDTVHAFLKQTLEINPPRNANTKWWTETFCEKAEARLTDPERRADAELDYLVCDEAQDLFANKRLFDILGCLLEHGWDKGRWALLGDLEHQRIQGINDPGPVMNDLAQAAQPTRWSLSENCRNLKTVGEYACSFSGFGDSLYSGYRREEGSDDKFGLIEYADPDDQSQKLKDCIRYFREQDFKWSEITILSPLSNPQSAAGILERQNYPFPSQNQHPHRFETIRKFKGMENKVIIITDIDLQDSDADREVLYTALTRPLDSVRLLHTSGSKKVLAKWIMEG